jgi:hypothetical protein
MINADAVQRDERHALAMLDVVDSDSVDLVIYVATVTSGVASSHERGDPSERTHLPR